MNYLVALYIVVSLFALGILHASHNYAYEFSLVENDAILGDQNSLTMTHILGEGCGCSDFVADYLLERGPKNSEDIIAIGNIEKADALKKVGFSIKAYEKEDSDLRGITGVPLFIVAKNKKVLYSGGYSDRMLTQHTKMKDIGIYNSIAKGIKQKSLPIFGCSNSKALKNYFDPLGFKY